MLSNYFPILIFGAMVLLMGTFLVAIGLILGKVMGHARPDKAKQSPYECGFEAFEDTRMKFDVRYYLVAILFIIFDLEVVFLFAWAVAVREAGWLGLIEISVFIFILIVALFYLWRIGALDWRTAIQRRELQQVKGSGGVVNRKELKL